MNRQVQGEDGREWQLRAQMEWRQPATEDFEHFEHDVAESYAPGIAMMSVAVALALILIIWMPDGVVVPVWVVLAVLLIVLFFPLRWVLRRPWRVVAETGGDQVGTHPAERWVGTVRGMVGVRGALARIAKNIERESLPGFSGPLRPVD